MLGKFLDLQSIGQFSALSFKSQIEFPHFDIYSNFSFENEILCTTFLFKANPEYPLIKSMQIY